MRAKIAFELLHLLTLHDSLHTLLDSIRYDKQCQVLIRKQIITALGAPMLEIAQHIQVDYTVDDTTAPDAASTTQQLRHSSAHFSALFYITRLFVIASATDFADKDTVSTTNKVIRTLFHKKAVIVSLLICLLDVDAKRFMYIMNQLSLIVLTYLNNTISCIVQLLF